MTGWKSGEGPRPRVHLGGTPGDYPSPEAGEEGQTGTVYDPYSTRLSATGKVRRRTVIVEDFYSSGTTNDPRPATLNGGDTNHYASKGYLDMPPASRHHDPHNQEPAPEQSHRPTFKNPDTADRHIPAIDNATEAQKSRDRDTKTRRRLGRMSMISERTRAWMAQTPRWLKFTLGAAATLATATLVVNSTAGLSNVKDTALNAIGQKKEAIPPEEALSRPFDLFPLSEGSGLNVHTTTDTEIHIPYTNKDGQEKLVTNMESTPIVMLSAEKEVWLRLLNTNPESTEEKDNALTVYKLADDKIEVAINWSNFGLYFADINLHESTKEYVSINYLFTKEQIEAANGSLLPDASPEENARIIELLTPSEDRDSHILFHAQYKAAEKIDNEECFADPTSSLAATLRSSVEEKIKNALTKESGYPVDNISVKHEGAPQGTAEGLLETFKDADAAGIVDPDSNGGITLSVANASCSEVTIND